MDRYNTFRNGKVHVLWEMCDSCIFRGGNLMDLMPGRVKGMVDECIRDGTIIPCHKTLRYSDGPAAGKNAICAGFWEGYRDQSWMLRLAMAMHRIKFVTMEELSGEATGQAEDPHDLEADDHPRTSGGIDPGGDERAQ